MPFIPRIRPGGCVALEAKRWRRCLSVEGPVLGVGLFVNIFVNTKIHQTIVTV